jgi:hypothetical protein
LATRHASLEDILHQNAERVKSEGTGLGCLDWDMVARYLPRAALRTCEFQTGNSPQEVTAGVRLLVERGGVIEP